MQEFQVLRVLEPSLRIKAPADSSSSRKDSICREEKRKTAWGACKGTRKLVITWVGLGIVFYSLFEYFLRAEMSLKCRQKFPRKEKCLLDHLSPFRASCSLSFTIFCFI
jgi:hypothetical protein